MRPSMKQLRKSLHPILSGRTEKQRPVFDMRRTLELATRSFSEGFELLTRLSSRDHNPPSQIANELPVARKHVLRESLIAAN